MVIREWLKRIADYLPFSLTKNQYYDRLTEKVIMRVCQKNLVCIDVGAHNGKILALFIKHCPLAQHIAFEPLPNLYKLLVRNFGSAAKIYPLALSNKRGTAPFNFVVSDPAYSGLRKRPDIQPEKEETIKVKTDLLDNIVAKDIVITLIKLDVEGGELDALLGASRIIQQYKPIILFEFGKGGSDVYGVTAQSIYNFFIAEGYEVNLLDKLLQNKPSFNLAEFTDCYYTGKEFFFIAYPKTL